MNSFSLSDGKRYRLRFEHQQHLVNQFVRHPTLGALPIQAQTTAVVELVDKATRKAGNQFYATSHCSVADQFVKAKGREVALDKLCRAYLSRQDGGKVKFAYYSRKRRMP